MPRGASPLPHRLQKACWDALRGALAAPPQPGDTLRFQLRPSSAGSGKSGSVHVGAELVPAEQQPASAEALTATSQDTPTASAGQQWEAAEALAAVAEAGSGGPEAAARLAQPAMLQPTAKGAGRLQTGKDGTGDRRARVTIRGNSRYAGYYGTGAAAAQAEDMIVLWVHGQSQGWPAGWLQGEAWGAGRGALGLARAGQLRAAAGPQAPQAADGGGWLMRKACGSPATLPALLFHAGCKALEPKLNFTLESHRTCALTVALPLH